MKIFVKHYLTISSISSHIFAACIFCRMLRNNIRRWPPFENSLSPLPFHPSNSTSTIPSPAPKPNGNQGPHPTHTHPSHSPFLFYPPPPLPPLNPSPHRFRMSKRLRPSAKGIPECCRPCHTCPLAKHESGVDAMRIEATDSI
jgi:hypothetical protein